MSIIRDETKNDQHRVSASKDLLDRAGWKATIKTENSIEVNYSEQARNLDIKLQNAFTALDESRTTEQDIIESD